VNSSTSSIANFRPVVDLQRDRSFNASGCPAAISETNLLPFHHHSLPLVKPDPTNDGQVVKSSIPTLVLQGLYDVQTNSTVGKQAMDGLSNGSCLPLLASPPC
jgi:hypothetical protein